jgi:hypothetical protein
VGSPPPPLFILLLEVHALVGYGIAAEIVSRRNLTYNFFCFCCDDDYDAAAAAVLWWTWWSRVELAATGS